MGEIVVAVQLENAIDRALQRRGALPESQVRPVDGAGGGRYGCGQAPDFT